MPGIVDGILFVEYTAPTLEVPPHTQHVSTPHSLAGSRDYSERWQVRSWQKMTDLAAELSLWLWLWLWHRTGRLRRKCKRSEKMRCVRDIPCARNAIQLQASRFTEQMMRSKRAPCVWL